MKVSVVMAVRNGAAYLPEAIESVLAQSVPEFEFLIVDDASSDSTALVLSMYQNRDRRIRVLRNEQALGPYPSVNRALSEARGTFIARHDADDISPPDRFAVQLAAFESRPGVSLATGEVKVFGQQRVDAKRTPRPPTWQPRLEWELLFGNAIGAGGHAMFPRQLANGPVLYSTTHPYAEDYALWCRLSRLGRVVQPPRVVYHYRVHGDSISSQRKAEQDACAAAIRSEYQANYVSPGTSRGALASLSRFWAGDARVPLESNFSAIDALFGDVRSNFLAYVERRYGIADRIRLAAELDDALRDRLGLWLYLSAKALRRAACHDLLAVARSRGDTFNISMRALRHMSSAAVRRMPWNR